MHTGSPAAIGRDRDGRGSACTGSAELGSPRSRAPLASAGPVLRRLRPASPGRLFLRSDAPGFPATYPLLAPTICAEFCICFFFAQGALCDPRLMWLQPSILVECNRPIGCPTLALLALFFSKKPVFGLFAAICKLEQIAGWMLTWKRSAHMLPNYELVP